MEVSDSETSARRCWTATVAESDMRAVQGMMARAGVEKTGPRPHALALGLVRRACDG